MEKDEHLLDQDEHLLDLKHRGLLPKKKYWTLRPSGSQVPLFYGLPKIHKPTIPLRPIVAANKAVTYQVSKFLSNLLSPLCGNSEHHIKDSLHFKDSTHNAHVTRTEVMVSFDVYKCSHQGSLGNH